MAASVESTASWATIVEGTGDQKTTRKIKCLVYAGGEGATGWVWRPKEDGIALKRARSIEFRNKEDLAWEANVYRRLGPHPRLLKMIDFTDNGLQLEYVAKGNLKDYLAEHPETTLEQRNKWATQAAEGLQRLHEHGLFHCDCKPSNLLVDDALGLRIIDFSDSKEMDTKRGSNEGTPSYCPRHSRDPRRPSPASEAFALVCIIFQIMTGTAPFEELPSDEVTRLYEQKQHPDLAKVSWEDFFELGFARDFARPSQILQWFRERDLETC